MQGGPDLSWLSGKFSYFFLFFFFGALGLSLSPFFPYFLLYLVSLFFSLSFPFLSTFASFAVTADFHLLLLFPLLPFPYALFEQLFCPFLGLGICIASPLSHGRRFPRQSTIVGTPTVHTHRRRRIFIRDSGKEAGTNEGRLKGDARSSWLIFPPSPLFNRRGR